MSEIVQEFTKKRRGRPPLYDWDSLFDEEIHVYYKGIDFQTNIESFRALVHRTASTRTEGGPWRTETRIDRNQQSVEFRFFKA